MLRGSAFILVKKIRVGLALFVCVQQVYTFEPEQINQEFREGPDGPILLSKHFPMYYWQDAIFNFGDYISLKLVERIVQQKVAVVPPGALSTPKLLAIGSIMTFARNNDVIWGSGVNGKCLDLSEYKFTKLDVRAVRGPLTRDFLMKHFKIACPETYGDPALLIPYFFPEFKRKKNPKYKYLIIPHYSEEHFFPKNLFANVVYPTEPWEVVFDKIMDSELVISSSLHGVIVAEAFGIPARCLKITLNEPMFKYTDYYLGTGRPDFKVAISVEEAVAMGGENPVVCDLKKLYLAFPFDLWPEVTFVMPSF